MPEWLTNIKNVVPAESLPEILGLFIIVCLLIILKRIRRGAPKAATETPFSEQPAVADLPGPAVGPIAPAEIKKPFPAPAEEPSAPPPDVFVKEDGYLDRLRAALFKTRRTLSNRFENILSEKQGIDDETLEAIEETLITADVGVAATSELIARISEKIRNISGVADFKRRLKAEMFSFLDLERVEKIPAKPHVILIVGVNGVGKTTTIGKLAARYAAQGKKVLLAACDTFRAAAVEQLEIWAGHAGAEIVKHRDKADPAAVAFDSIEAAVAREVDVVIVDTAGRLHTKVNLMEQLKKIQRSIAKGLSSAPHEVILVLDATTGQNAVSQARLFHDEIGITGIILTKLDGTAKGGIAVAICHELKIPIRDIGVGERIEDLQPFDPKLFLDALI
jgi:fused signal recognition particle receptor